MNPQPIATPRAVLRNGNFARLLTGQFISQLGDGLVFLSLMIMLNRMLGADAASAIGMVTADPATRVMFRRDGSEVPLRMPAQDPFWPVFFGGLK